MILDVNLLLTIHERIINTSGGTQGVRDFKSLESAIYSIHQTFDGDDLYPTHLLKASRLCFALNLNHPFLDRNKRISMHMLMLYLRFHQIPFHPTNAEVFKIGMVIATRKINFMDLFIWVSKTIQAST